MLNLVVIRSHDVPLTRRFYEAMGLTFTTEKHGNGPEHAACVMPGGLVFEIYPYTASSSNTVDTRLGFTVPDVLAFCEKVKGLHGRVFSKNREHALVSDPEGHKIDLTPEPGYGPADAVLDKLTPINGPGASFDLETLGMGGPKDHFGSEPPDDFEGMGIGMPKDDR